MMMMATDEAEETPPPVVAVVGQVGRGGGGGGGTPRRRYTEETLRQLGIKPDFLPCLAGILQQPPVHRLDHPLPFPPVACYAVPTSSFPTTTLRGRTFRIPSFFGSIKPHFLPVHLADPERVVVAAAAAAAAAESEGVGNVLLDMGDLIAFMGLSPHHLGAGSPQSQHDVRERALPPLRQLWSALLDSPFRPKDPEQLNEEYLISYFYRPLLGAGPHAREAVARWKVQRAGMARTSSTTGHQGSQGSGHGGRRWGDEMDSDEREDKLLGKLVAKRKLKRRGAGAGAGAGLRAIAVATIDGSGAEGQGQAQAQGQVLSGSEEEEEEELLD